MAERVVKVAYVTKWAGPIQVWRNPSVSDSGYCWHYNYYKNGKSVGPDYWTEDRAEAEKRWRANRNKELKAAERKLNAAAKALRDGPTWEER